MARPRVTIDSKGILDVLKSAGVTAVVAAKTEQVADNVRSLGIMVDGIPGKYALPVETSMTTTDRAHGRVTLAHPSGMAVQAKHGALTKAALAADLEVVNE